MASGEGLVTAADLQLPSDLEVVNPEQPILTLDSHDADLHLELLVRTGRGYSPGDERGRLAIGELPVDAIFSPVRRVAFDVHKTRVGRLSNYDSLILEVWTDGSMSPSDALTDAAAILAGKFGFIAGYGTEPLRAVPSEQGNIPPQVYETKRAGLTRVGEILDRMAQGPDEMLVIRNFGQKSLDELKVALIAKGFDEHLQAALAAAGNGNKE
jgi:DNA-directed RNA polymerase subunit alpha